MSLLLTISYPLSCLITVGALVLAMACLGIVAWNRQFFQGYPGLTRALVLGGLLSAGVLCLGAGAVNFQTFRETKQLLHERTDLDQEISDLEEERVERGKSLTVFAEKNIRLEQATNAAQLRVVELESQVAEFTALEIQNATLAEQNAIASISFNNLRDAVDTTARTIELLRQRKAELEAELKVKASALKPLRNSQHLK